ncbi:NnrU family protein [Pseudovibrio brasiliensis]|uniref:NnrU family protein n=1 Tax=Pseudovibrio brasiliensis TaxID=1898042 RepID=A0ABX8AR22_9HYPH|nr:NnrU family protein [Pseudovibrio brasiliensis]QUS57513.1 NnrU family protein [Pseudovibrio brasiliensis]
MTLLISGLAAFFAVHLIPSFTGLRESLVQRLTFNGYRGIYTLVSLGGLVAVVYGFGAAWHGDYTPWYVPPSWGRHVTMLLMLPVFPLFFASQLKGNITRVTKHPLINATKLWAVAHLFANGELYSVVLFGSFLIWAIIVRITIAKRERITPPNRDYPNAMKNDVISVGLGLIFYGLFVWKLHAILIGVPIIT